ncbi:MAG: PepSY domain-containing protein [Sphingobacterium sp.]|jgi:uncharacterized iron-regulated membrane protein|nr:PepSY domain-containing protein [Sphingobacterium sp.]
MKGLGTRLYNIFFHTHTVSGIVISAVLFIIFFAGALSLYKQEMYQWENPAARGESTRKINYEQLIHRIDSAQSGIKEAQEIRVVLPTQAKPIYTIYAGVQNAGSEAYVTAFYNPIDDKITTLEQGNTSTVGETLYRLHFLDQIPLYLGRYIAGFVALFFAFAIITGVLIHWKNIISKFYAFSFRKTKKQFWTNAHTVFGLIGLPFQLMYAITGAFYLLSVFILAPAVILLFNNDQDRLVTMLYPMEAFHEHEGVAATATHGSIGDGLAKIRRDYPAYTVSYLEIINLGRKNAVLGAELINQGAFNANGTVVLDLLAGQYKLEIKPGQKKYAQSLLNGIAVLHFANFGGWLIKALYFVLSMFTCFVIISGVLMWKQARDKPSYTARQRAFHHRVTMFYLSACFSLFPATALLFLTELVVPMAAGHVDRVNSLFFVFWLIVAACCCFRKTEDRITGFCLTLGGILSLGVPLANGMMTEDWMWRTFNKLPYVFAVDLLWVMTGIVSLLFAGAINRKKSGANVPEVY